MSSYMYQDWELGNRIGEVLRSIMVIILISNFIKFFHTSSYKWFCYISKFTDNIYLWYSYNNHWPNSHVPPRRQLLTWPAVTCVGSAFVLLFAPYGFLGGWILAGLERIESLSQYRYQVSGPSRRPAILGLTCKAPPSLLTEFSFSLMNLLNLLCNFLFQFFLYYLYFT
jgi:hypothetical protein